MPEEKKKFSLTVLPDGDIEINEVREDGSTNCVYHKSYNPGESLKRNVIDAYDALVQFEKGLTDEQFQAYLEDCRKRNIQYAKLKAIENFSNIVEQIKRQQKKPGQPIYAIVRWRLGSFAGIEWWSENGDEDLPELKDIFMDKYAWTPGSFGITEEGYTIVRLDVSKVFDIHGTPNCNACTHCDAYHRCELTGIDAKDPCERFLLRGITSNQSNSQGKKEA